MFHTILIFRQDPKDFIKVLCAFSSLPAHRLGWDPTMKVYRSPDNWIPSYRIPPDSLSEGFEPNLYHVNWVISMPCPKEGNSDSTKESREYFVTVRAIVATSSQRVSSRATVVWEVVKLDDIDKRDCQVQKPITSVAVLKMASDFCFETSMATNGIEHSEMQS